MAAGLAPRAPALARPRLRCNAGGAICIVGIPTAYTLPRIIFDLTVVNSICVFKLGDVAIPFPGPHRHYVVEIKLLL